MYKSVVDEAAVTELKEAIQLCIDFSESVSDERLFTVIEQKISEMALANRWTSTERIWLARRMMNRFRGLDILEPLLEDENVTEIMVNSYQELFYERNGRIYPYPYTFESAEQLENIIQTIVSKVNRTVNEFSPIVDARLSDGSRVHVVLPPIALKGPTLTIRKFPASPPTMEQLINTGTFTIEVAQFLRKAVQAKYNIFVCGGTGSGKTTLLNVLAQAIPEDERVVTIEDSAELQLHSVKNVVAMETRAPNTEGKGEITIRQLIRASLRMRPNRIIVGEVRGEEAIDMLQAMNTGHDGSLSTGHANSIVDMLSRLETMALSGFDLPLESVRKQIASAIELFIHVARGTDHLRKIVEISEITGYKNGEYELNPLFVRKGSELVRTSASLKRVRKWKEVWDEI